MKTTIPMFALAAVLALLAGCSSMPDKEQRCATYAELYQLYLVSAAARPVSPEEIATATAAAGFLQAHCNWTATRGKDTNGVPVIHPPK